MSRFKRLLNPEWFQGNMKHKNYFEGWYYKLVSADRNQTWAFIPGISLNDNDKHSFIQVINGMNGETSYLKYRPEEFTPANNSLDILVAESKFTNESLSLNIKEDKTQITGHVRFINNIRFPVSWLRPGIMGWYRYVPFMECYHGVVSLDHSLVGKLNINKSEIDFTGGRGYIEKDWGTSMPKAWIWMQSNHFETTNTSFMLSVARIPWFGSSFTGFLGFFLVEGKLHPFATYTGARITHLEKSVDGIKTVIESRQFIISVRGMNTLAGKLKAPVDGSMQRIIHESVNAEIQISMADRGGKTIFEGTGVNAGLEVVGDLNLLKLS